MQQQYLHLRPSSRLPRWRLLVRVTVCLLLVAHFYKNQQLQLKKGLHDAKDHTKIIPYTTTKTEEEEVNKFYAWGDPNGINITSLLSYYKWLTIEGIHNERWSFDNMPLVPVSISKDHTKMEGGQFIVKISRAAFWKIPNAVVLWNMRAVPFLNFIVETLNRPIDKHRQPPRRDATRLLQLLDQGYDIPFLMDFGDVPSCGDRVFNRSSIVSPQHYKLFNLQLPIFGMCRQRECNYSFPLPTYWGLIHSKISSDEWDNYFQNSALLYPWESKINAAVWRGATTGSQWFPGRAWLVEQTVKAPSVIDAQFVTPKLGKYKMSFQDFQRYKAVVDIDGNGWSGRFHGLLCMNSVALKIRPRFLDYNAVQLKEWTHYIPYDANLNISFPDFVNDVLRNENDAKLRHIVSNAQAWCREHMSRTSIQDDLLDIFASYVAELDKKDASWETKWMFPIDLLDAVSFSFGVEGALY